MSIFITQEQHSTLHYFHDTIKNSNILSINVLGYPIGYALAKEPRKCLTNCTYNTNSIFIPYNNSVSWTVYMAKYL